MNGCVKGRRARWVRVGLAVAVVIAAHVIDGGSAEAASIAPKPAATPRVVVAHHASATPDFVLGAFTSQNYPGFLEISGDGRTLKLGAVSLVMSCTSGAQFVLADVLTRVRIKANGRLHAAHSVPPTAGSNGDTYSATDSLTARLNRRHSLLTGTWRLQVSYSFTNGMSDQCDSGPVRFTATG